MAWGKMLIRELASSERSERSPWRMPVMNIYPPDRGALIKTTGKSAPEFFNTFPVKSRQEKVLLYASDMRRVRRVRARPVGKTSLKSEHLPETADEASVRTGKKVRPR